jgi:hypothetical protein
VRAFLVHVLVRLGETAQADVALTEMPEEEREKPGIRTAVAALRLAQDNPRAAAALGRCRSGACSLACSAYSAEMIASTCSSKADGSSWAIFRTTAQSTPKYL